MNLEDTSFILQDSWKYQLLGINSSIQRLRVELCILSLMQVNDLRGGMGKPCGEYVKDKEWPVGSILKYLYGRWK